MQDGVGSLICKQTRLKIALSSATWTQKVPPVLKIVGRRVSHLLITEYEFLY